jgi:4-carboxymuconolactone decarboxylase
VSSPPDRRQRGLSVRRAVLGDEHVDTSIAGTTALDAPFQEYITGAAWADVWDRPGLPRSTRSLLTIALLAALGHERELEMHLRASRRTGATPEQIGEALLHVAVYAGVPAANSAFAALKRVLGPHSTTDTTGAEDPRREGPA